MSDTGKDVLNEFERPQMEPKGKAYRLTADWHTNCKGVLTGKILVPAGFVTDGASIPRILWTACGSPMDTPRIYAAIVHDWLYEKSGKVEIDGVATKFDREASDKIYRDYQISLGIPKWKAYLEYYSIRLCGGGHWKKDEDEEGKEKTDE